jgi:uncharacterized damage-inducible protein DinB
MGRGFEDLIAHNGRATRELLAYCQGLDEATLAATAPGTFGSILETLQHLVDSEGSYVRRLTGAWADHPWKGDREVGLETMAERATILEQTLSQFLAGDWDTEALGEGRGDEGEIFAIRAGIFLTQAIHHANEHRAHVCTILGTLGHEPPDVSGWGYALATGRLWSTSPSPEP